MKMSCSLPLLPTAVRHLSHPGRRAQSAGLTPTIILPGQRHNPAALLPLSYGSTRRFWLSADAVVLEKGRSGVPTEPTQGRPLSPARAQPRPAGRPPGPYSPAGRPHSHPRAAAARARLPGPERRPAPGPSEWPRRAARGRPGHGPSPPARLAPLRARAGPRKGPAARDPLQTAFPMQRPSRPQLTCRSWYRTAHADRRDRHGKLQPGATAHSLRHSNGAALHAGPRPASLRLRQRRAVLCRNKAPSGGRSAATHRRPSEAGRGHRAVGGAVVPRGAQPPFPRARGRASFALPAVFPPRAAQQRLLKRAGGKGPVSKQAGSASLHSGVAHRRKAFWCVMFLEYLYWIGNFATLDLYCVRRQLMTQHSYELQMLKLEEKSTLTAEYSWVQTASVPLRLGCYSSPLFDGVQLLRTYLRNKAGGKDGLFL